MKQTRIAALPIALALAAGLAAARPAQAQGILDPDTCTFCARNWPHIPAGAILALSVRGPWVTHSYRDAMWKRVGWVVLLSAIQEGAQTAYAAISPDQDVGTTGYGFSLLDMTLSTSGALAIEGVVGGLEKLFCRCPKPRKH